MSETARCRPQRRPHHPVRRVLFSTQRPSPPTSSPVGAHTLCRPGQIASRAQLCVALLVEVREPKLECARSAAESHGAYRPVQDRLKGLLVLDLEGAILVEPRPPEVRYGDPMRRCVLACGCESTGFEHREEPPPRPLMQGDEQLHGAVLGCKPSVDDRFRSTSRARHQPREDQGESGDCECPGPRGRPHLPMVVRSCS
jgi:hypothetical protein